MRSRDFVLEAGNICQFAKVEDMIDDFKEGSTTRIDRFNEGAL
jgi:hypothetical protein